MRERFRRDDCCPLLRCCHTLSIESVGEHFQLGHIAVETCPQDLVGHCAARERVANRALAGQNGGHADAVGDVDESSRNGFGEGREHRFSRLGDSLAKRLRRHTLMLLYFALELRDISRRAEHEKRFDFERRVTLAKHARRGNHLERERIRVLAPRVFEEVVVRGLERARRLQRSGIGDHFAGVRTRADTPETRLPEAGAVLITDRQRRTESPLEPNDVGARLANEFGEAVKSAIDVDPENLLVGETLTHRVKERHLAPTHVCPVESRLFVNLFEHVLDAEFL